MANLVDGVCFRKRPTGGGLSEDKYEVNLKMLSTLCVHSDLEPGLYRHYKGANYQVLTTAIHSETEELMVVYQALYGEQGLWVRPYDMFVSTVQVNGQNVSRFSRVES